MFKNLHDAEVEEDEVSSFAPAYVDEFQDSVTFSGLLKRDGRGWGFGVRGGVEKVFAMYAQVLRSRTALSTNPSKMPSPDQSPQQLTFFFNWIARIPNRRTWMVAPDAYLVL